MKVPVRKAKTMKIAVTATPPMAKEIGTRMASRKMTAAQAT